MKLPSPYTYDFDPDGESTAARVCRQVGFYKQVLELGCAYGVMTRVLSEHYHCKVFGVEYDATSAARAASYCEEVRVADLEQLDWNELLGDKKFDVIVAADVLEHLRDPLACLNQARRFLKPEGYFVCSIPNIAHNGVIAELLNEDFSYRRVGLLDETHLRFFGYESIKRTMRLAGLSITHIEPTRARAETSEFADTWKSLPRWLREALEVRPLGDIYQFVFAAVPTAAGKAATEAAPLDARWEPTISPTLERLEKELEDVKHALETAVFERAAAVAEMNQTGQERDALRQQLDQVVNSRSWRITRPLRVFGRTVRHGLQLNGMKQVMDRLRPVYHKLPIPSALRPRISRVARRLFRSRHALGFGPWNPPDPAIRIAPKESGKPDYIIFGVIDWHFRHQRPQQLALQLAGSGRRVFYLSVDFIDAGDPGFSLEPLDQHGRLFNLHLRVKGSPSVYDTPPGPMETSQLREGLGLLLGWADSSALVALVQHPYWYGVAATLPNARLVYDCMDHHEGFGNVSPAMIAHERALFAGADLTVTTSLWLDAAVQDKATRHVLIRNAADYEHFATRPASIYQDQGGRRIIGYYGAIAGWFDTELVAAVSEAFSDCVILLVGADTAEANKHLARRGNVVFVGEVPYAELPRYAHAFDVCILPFKVIPLTLATNPVKVYEYLSMGKPVVSTDLPEVRQMGEHCRVAQDTKGFIAAVHESLADRGDKGARQRFASEQTWGHRAAELVSVAESTEHDPLVSVIVVTYNNLELTKQCLASVEALSDYPNLEVIVVDNASSDGSPEWLSEWATGAHGRQLILNTDNLGFAAGNNQGLRAARGDYLIMLNNDTYVTLGWVRTMMNHMRRDPGLGLLGPVTNNIGNEACIEIHYDDMAQMLACAKRYTRNRMGRLFPLRTAAFFCVMLRRSTFEQVGLLDEAFGRGFFEDDDYCRRVEQAGLRIVCAEDVFIHHHLSASFNKLKQSERQRLFEENKKIYEQKWGKWIPHDYRD